MGKNLQKGQTINLEKSQYDLSKVTLGLGWDVKKQGGFFGGLFGGKKDDEYDLDAIAFLLDANGKVVTPGNNKLVGGDVVFFNNLRHPSGCVYHTGDNLTGEGDGDDEQIVVLLDSLPAAYSKIVFLVSIYQGARKGQNFGKIENAFIRAVDNKGKEMARYDLSEDASFANMRSMVFAELYRRGGDWKFRAIGTPYETDSFVDILRNYL